MKCSIVNQSIWFESFFLALHVLFTDHWDWIDCLYFMWTLRLNYRNGSIHKGSFHSTPSCYKGLYINYHSKIVLNFLNFWDTTTTYFLICKLCSLQALQKLFWSFVICITLNFELLHVPKTGFVCLVSTYYFYIILPVICTSTSTLMFPIQYCLLVQNKTSIPNVDTQ